VLLLYKSQKFTAVKKRTKFVQQNRVTLQQKKQKTNVDAFMKKKVINNQSLQFRLNSGKLYTYVLRKTKEKSMGL